MICDGGGCDACGERGVFEVECPRQYIDAGMRLTLELSTFAEKGSWPVAGGVLDQSHSFVSACRFIDGERQVWKAKMRIPNLG